MKKNLSFLHAVNSRAELDGVIPTTSLAFARDDSKQGVFDRFFVFADGAWQAESVEVSNDYSRVVHGSEMHIQCADGTVRQGVFTVIKGEIYAFELATPQPINYGHRFYSDEVGGAERDYSLIARVPKRVQKSNVVELDSIRDKLPKHPRKISQEGRRAPQGREGKQDTRRPPKAPEGPQAPQGQKLKSNSRNSRKKRKHG